MPSIPREELPFWRRLVEAAALALLLTGVYMGAGNTRPATSEPFSHVLDPLVPFVPETVWIYLPGYWLGFLVTVWAVRDPRHFRAGMTGLAAITLLALPFFLAWPVAAPRPPAPGDETLTAAMVRWLYASDPVGNTFPSLHVANVTFCAAITTAASRAWGAALWVLALAVAVSVLTLKQHWAIDVPGGWALAGAGVVAWRASLAAPALIQALPARAREEARR